MFDMKRVEINSESKYLIEKEGVKFEKLLAMFNSLPTHSKRILATYSEGVNITSPCMFPARSTINVSINTLTDMQDMYGLTKLGFIDLVVVNMLHVWKVFNGR